MRRLIGLALALASPAAVLAQPAPDRVTYRTAEGKVTVETVVAAESPKGLLLGAGSAPRTVSYGDVLRVELARPEGLADPDQATLRTLDNLDPAKAVEAATALAARYPQAPERTRRALAWAKATQHLRAVAAAGEQGDPQILAKAQADALDALKLAGRQGAAPWEVAQSARFSARILAEQGKSAEAAKVLEGAADGAGTPADLAAALRLQAARLSHYAGRPDDAASALARVSESTLAANQAERFGLLKLAGADPAALRRGIDAATTPGAKAFGYGLLGDAYARLKQPQQALWAYLWVDAVYDADSLEQALALSRAGAHLEARGEAERAEQLRDKARRLP